MKIFLTGATGYVGQSIIRALHRHGHSVRGLTRNTKGISKLQELGVMPVQGDIRDLDLLRTEAQRADAVIHAAFGFEPDVASTDRNATQSMLDGLIDSGKAFVYTSGAWIYGGTGGSTATEASALDVPPIYQFTGRAGVEELVQSYANRGVRTIVTRGGLAYGHGAGPIALFLSQLQHGRSLRHVGDGENRFPAVHIDDFGEAYALAIQHAEAGAIYNLTDGSEATYREIFQLIAKANGDDITVSEWPLQDAREVFAQFADAFTMDQLVSSDKARRELGWQPHSPNLMEEIASGAYSI